uniref:DNA polymerase beta n=1 Tax=candidate division CPR3 bacterium TaxID=2268181 RepID=A0A7V3J9J3_UNCC3
MKINKVLAKKFEELANALDFLGENPFKVRAYLKVAKVLEELPEDVTEIYKVQGFEGLERIPGIGEGIAKKIVEFIEKGTFEKYEEVMSKVPADLLKLMDVPGVGPRTLKLIYDKFKVTTMDEFIKILDDPRILTLPGMGEKKIENIKRGLELYLSMQERIPLGIAVNIVEDIIEYMKESKKVELISGCGSYRRMKETVGDIDILVVGEDGAKLIEHFTKFPSVTDVLASGDTKGSVIVEGKYQVDMRVVGRESWGAALQYFTGSKNHNIKLRTIAKAKGLKISEYGVFREEKLIAGAEEEDVYKSLGLPWIPPELREDQGEIEAAMSGNLPVLLGYNEVKGDLHVHSNYSDGTSSLEELVEFARKMGYQYLGICDHSRSAKYAGGLEIDELRERNREIDRINKSFKDFVLLKGAEVDILSDGQLDYPDEILRELDFVVASIHIWKKNEDATQRIIKAMENPYVTIIGHPTGRLIGQREGYHVDIDTIIDKAVETKTFLEMNAYYERLDFNDVNARKAKEKGVLLVINTDAHHVGQLPMIRLGIGQARRAWLGPQDVVNTRNLSEVVELLKIKLK